MAPFWAQSEEIEWKVAEVTGLARNIKGEGGEGRQIKIKNQNLAVWVTCSVGSPGTEKEIWWGSLGSPQILHRLLRSQIFYPDPGLKPLSRGPSRSLWPPKDPLPNPADPVPLTGEPFLSPPSITFSFLYKTSLLITLILGPPYVIRPPTFRSILP